MDVTVMGRIGYDLFAEQQGLPLPEVRSFRRGLGGSSANIAVGLARQGLEVGLHGCVGDDLLGEFLIDFLRRESVDTAFVRTVDGHPSSLCLTEVCPPSSFRQVFYRRQPADVELEVDGRDHQRIASSRLFVTNGTSLCAPPSRESTLEALQRARQAGVRTAFDVDYRDMSWNSAGDAAALARRALEHVDVVLANPEELELVTGDADVESAAAVLLETGVEIVVAKRGADGTALFTRGRKLFLPPYPVEPQCTIGAGDGFAAGFLASHVRGEPLETSLRRGNAAAAIVVSRLMCAEEMPTADEIEALLARYPDLPLSGE